MSDWIGVDLDGTLAEYRGWQGVENIGAPIKPICDRVRRWLKKGIEVRIFTARVSERDLEERTRCFLAIENFCVREFGEVLRITNVKDFDMIELWDDRAVQVVFNTGERVGYEWRSPIDGWGPDKDGKEVSL